MTTVEVLNLQILSFLWILEFIMKFTGPKVKFHAKVWTPSQDEEVCNHYSWRQMETLETKSVEEIWIIWPCCGTHQIQVQI